MSTIKFISNNKIKITPSELLEIHYPEIVDEKYNCDFYIEIDGKTFFGCSGNSFALMEFLQSVVRWVYRTDDLYYNSVETDDNPLISFIMEKDGLYSINSPWQEFECKERFTFAQLKSVLDLADIKLAAYDDEETIIEQEGYRFSAYVERTREYYQTLELCDCSVCRNFYCQIKEALPEVDKWLSGFGVNIERPDETNWYQNEDDTIWYSACYTVCGEVMKSGEDEFEFYDNLSVTAAITTPDEVGGYVPNSQENEYFIIHINDIILPWVLNEKLPEEANIENSFQQTSQKQQGVFNKIKNWFKR